MTVFDNLEQENLSKEKLEFMLTAVTGVSRKKIGADGQEVEQRVKTLIAITSIEPFKKFELNNRVLEVECSKDFHRSSFIDDVVISEILKNRDLILNSLFQLYSAEVLPDLNKKRDELLGYIKQNFSSHSKSRSNGFLSIMGVIAGALSKEFGGQSSKSLLAAWLESQERAADISADSVILSGLESFFDEFRKNGLGAYSNVEVIQTTQRTYEFYATPNSLNSILTISLRAIQKMNPHRNSNAQLISRLKNDLDFLKIGGWTVELCFKRVRGVNYHKFVKKF